MNRTATLLVLGMALLLPGATRALAEVDPRLAGRLDPATAAAVESLLVEARTRGLPTGPLAARALEGASRQVPGPRIVAAVDNLAQALESARDALGAASSQAELEAGAAALSAGVRADSLASLRASRRDASLVVPLVVLTDLVTRRVPPETATAAVVAATRAHVRDKDLMRLRERIGQDIQSGVPPGNATIQRTRSLVRSFQAPNAPQPAPAGERKVVTP